MGVYRWINNHVKRFPIPKTDQEGQERISKLVDEIILITSSDSYDPQKPPEKQAELEHQIDQMVYKLYDLTKKEIEIIESHDRK